MKREEKLNLKKNLKPGGETILFFILKYKTVKKHSKNLNKF
jgi:hypothetical protein